MSKEDLKGKRIGMVGTLGHIGIGRDCFAASIILATPTVIHAVNNLNKIDEQEAKQKAKESRLVMHLKPYTPDPMPEVRIEKKDRFSFLDGLYGRGKGRAKSQGFAQHFKR